jgi:hypothetical protein
MSAQHTVARQNSQSCAPVERTQKSEDPQIAAIPTKGREGLSYPGENRKAGEGPKYRGENKPALENSYAVVSYAIDRSFKNSSKTPNTQ